MSTVEGSTIVPPTIRTDSEDRHPDGALYSRFISVTDTEGNAVLVNLNLVRYVSAVTDSHKGRSRLHFDRSHSVDLATPFDELAKLLAWINV